ncbi:hypothetical protein BGX30_006995 [Mortierella sp. GBA39]|nr:hypothetical protein BGX30_006995 [Mortierella sp. GBA39]
MAPRFPPQSRMPTLLPQKTEVLWYPRERDVEHMHDELSHEEKEFTAKLKKIRFSGTHLIPVGLSKPFIDMDEEGEDEDEEDDEEEDDEDAEVEGEGEDDLDMGRDLDEDIGQSGDDEEEEDEDTHIYGDQSNYSIEDDDSRQDMMLTMDRLLEEQRRSTMVHEQHELDHCQRIDDQSFIYSPYPSRHYHKDNGSGGDGDGDEGDIDDNNGAIDDRDTRFTHHHRRPREPYHEAEGDEEGDGGLLGIDEDEQGEEEMNEERDLDADIEVASSFGGGSDYDEYDHDEHTSRYRTPSPQL